MQGTFLTIKLSFYLKNLEKYKVSTKEAEKIKDQSRKNEIENKKNK